MTGNCKKTNPIEPILFAPIRVNSRFLLEHFGVIVDKLGVVLEYFGVILDTFGVISDNFRSIKTPKIRIFTQKTPKYSILFLRLRFGLLVLCLHGFGMVFDHFGDLCMSVFGGE